VTDGRTDGIAVANTALAMRALRRAVKTLHGNPILTLGSLPRYVAIW